MFVPVLVLCLANYVVAYEGASLMRYELDSAHDYFSWFVKTYNKKYANPVEEKKRFDIFTTRLENINKKNEAHGGAVFGITQFLDLTSDEFLNMHAACFLDKDIETVCDIKNVTNAISGKAPEEFDWRTKNVVTDVKNQLECGSCWAFGATGNIEGQYAIKYGKLEVLSEQQLVDCDTKSHGCDGGLPDNAMKMLISSGGQLREKDYPYEETQNKCTPDMSKAVAKLSNCISYDTDDEEKLKELLFTTGPLTIAADALPIMDYAGGVLKDCPFERLNHALLLVGYGKDKDGTPYWLIKNSWGKKHGEEGYVRIQRGVNACGLMRYYAVTAVMA